MAVKVAMQLLVKRDESESLVAIERGSKGERNAYTDERQWKQW